MIFSIITLFLQLSAIFACCSAAGLTLNSILPKGLSPVYKVLFSLVAGLFLVVLVPQNLFYLGVPVRISAWFALAVAVFQICFYRRRLLSWIRTLGSNADIRTLSVVVLITIGFHSVIPIRQGLEWYYGKGHFDQINYVLLAEFLKEEPYSTSTQNIGFRP